MDNYMNANMVFSKFARDYMGLKEKLPLRPSEMGVLNIITWREGNFTTMMLAEMICGKVLADEFEAMQTKY